MKIFISYRRDDSAGYAGRLFDHLAAHFGSRNIFMDIDTINPGDDFRKVVQQAIGTCDVVLVMMGKQWLNMTDAQGRRRLDDPRDWVRVEIASALANPQVRVIPVLLRDAVMPGPHELPEELKEFSWRNAVELSDNRFQYDANQLIKFIERSTIGEKPKVRSIRPWAIMGALVVIGLLLTIGFSIISPLLYTPPKPANLPEPTLASPTIVLSVSPSTNQTAESPIEAPSLNVRKLEMRDLTADIPSIWMENGIQIEDMPSPGRISYTGTVRTGKEYLFFLYWCATNQDTLNQNMENMKLSFYVNEEPLPGDTVLYYDNDTDNYNCRYAVVALSGWVANEEYTLEARRQILQEISDGEKIYPAGDYIREVIVTAR